MNKTILIVVLSGLTACAPYVNAGNRNGVTIYVANTSYEAEALKVADDHCSQYGMTAKFRKPRGSGKWGDLYDYNCVK